MQLRDYTEKIEYLKSHQEAFIGAHTTRSIIRFLKRRSDAGDSFAMLYSLALKAEISNIKAKMFEFEGDETKKAAQYCIKHECLRQLCAEIRAWNLMHEDGLILYGYGVDYNAGLPVLYFNLPDTEQISFHDNIRRDMLVPRYPLEWDGYENTTLPKLRQGIINRYYAHISKFFDNSVIKTDVLEYPSDSELFDNIRTMNAEDENIHLKHEYIMKKMCGGLGYTNAMHEIKQSQKIEQENSCPTFIFRIVGVELERVTRLKNKDNTPDTAAVEGLVKNLINMKSKGRKFSAKVKVKKVRSLFGKYLVGIEFGTERGGIMKTSFYSSRTPLKKNSPSWIMRADVTPELPKNNIENMENFIENYIKTK